MKFRGLVLSVVGLSVAASSLVVPATSNASYLLDRQSTNISVQADKKGNALFTYRQKGKVNRVLVWGGINDTLKFKLDRSAGWKSKRSDPKKPFPNVCRKVGAAEIQAQAPLTTDNPAGQQVNAWNVAAACKAPDGSYWVAQQWPRLQQDFGGLEAQTVKELRISHFSGQLANMWIKADYSYSGMWQHIYGQLLYKGVGFWGKGGQFGASIDGRARNVAFDAWNSDYPGTTGQWARVNAILTNEPNGQFCFGFAPKLHTAADATDAFRSAFPLWQNALNYSGTSSSNQYRAIVPGPGVSPDVEVEFGLLDPAAYWPAAPNDGSSQSGHRANSAGLALDAQANAAQQALLGGTGIGSCATIN